MKKVLIGGIGNVLLGDDGVGPYVVQVLASRYEFEDGVEVVDLGTPALDLIDRISGKDLVVLIDSVKSSEAAGTVLLYPKEEIMQHRPPVRMDPHSPALVDAVLSAELFGVAPANLLLIGIAAETFDTGCSMSEAVRTSLEPAIEEVIHELDRFGILYAVREKPTGTGIWWAHDDNAEAQPTNKR
jgi:hydrogenase maturation protease